MTIIKIIGALQAKGYSVTYYKRKDGGYLITKINEQRFSGAKGNLLARSMLGESLSVRKEAQLRGITRERIELGDIYKAYKKVAQAWRKNPPKNAGKMTLKKLKYQLKHHKKEEVLQMLLEKDKYRSGYAYSKNVEILAEYIEHMAYLLEDDIDTSDLYDLAVDVRNAKDFIKEEWISPAYDELYRLNNEPLTDSLISEVIHNVRNILNLK